MTSINLAGCTALEIIYCRSNDLTSVDFSTNTNLKFIETFDNRLTEIDLSPLKSWSLSTWITTASSIWI